MTLQARSWRSATAALLPVATAALAAGVFVAEAITSMKLVVAVCYVVVVLLAARFSSARGVVLVGAGCVGLTLLAFFLPGFSETEAGGTGVKASISAVVIGLTTFLVTEQKRATEALRESEQQWREVFEHNPVMYFIVGPIGTVLSVNEKGRQPDYRGTDCRFDDAGLRPAQRRPKVGQNGETYASGANQYDASRIAETCGQQHHEDVK